MRRWMTSFVALALGVRLIAAPAQQPQQPPSTRDSRVATMEAQQAALSVRHAASNGLGAPQIGLNPDWPNHDYGYWERAKQNYPDATAPYEPCVEKFREVIEIVKSIAPLTRRPAWDHSGPQINEALRRGSAAMQEGDQCLKDVSNGRKPMLQGRVQQDVGDPGSPPPDPSANGGGGVDMFALLRQFSQTLNAMAPHYDMTRPHEGLRVLGDIAIAMGLGYVAKGLPGAVRTVLGRGGSLGAGGAAGAAPMSVGGWISGATRTSNGLQIPASVWRLPRPLYLQETAATCGAACVRMVGETVTGKGVSEAAARTLLGQASADAGVYTGQIENALTKLGIPTQLVTNATIQDLETAVSKGLPAIIHTGAANSGHFMIVDGFAAAANGEKFALLRDPSNLSMLDNMSRQVLEQAGFSNQPVIALNDLAQMFRGEMLKILSGAP